jgi:hypothetical protein
MPKTTLEMCRRPAMTTVNFPVFLVGWSTKVMSRARYWPTLGARIPSPVRYTGLSPDRFKKVLAELTMCLRGRSQSAASVEGFLAN